MTFRYNIKCNVCENPLVIKNQGGFVENANVRIGCPHCKSIIKGQIYQNAPQFGMCFENATHLTDDSLINDSVHVIATSTELPIYKGFANTIKLGGFSFSPYHALSMSGLLTFSQIEVFKNQYLNFKSFRDKNLSILESIIELFQNYQWEYVNKQIKNNFFPKLPNDLPNTMESCSDLLSQVLNLFINKIIPSNYESSYSIRLLQNSTLNKVQHSKNHLFQIHEDVKDLVNIEKEYINSIQLILSFIKNIESYLPVIAICYGQGFKYDSKNDLSITTFSFDELKDKFKDTFELSTRVSLIYLAFSNFNRNQSSNDFSDIDSNCKDLLSFYKITNGNKKSILDKIPKFQEYYRNLLNSQIRNSIGHNKTEYITTDQIIRYYPYTDIAKKDMHKEISLFDFAYMTLQLNLLTMDFISFVGKWNRRMK